MCCLSCSFSVCKASQKLVDAWSADVAGTLDTMVRKTGTCDVGVCLWLEDARDGDLARYVETRRHEARKLFNRMLNFLIDVLEESLFFTNTPAVGKRAAHLLSSGAPEPSWSNPAIFVLMFAGCCRIAGAWGRREEGKNPKRSDRKTSCD